MNERQSRAYTANEILAILRIVLPAIEAELGKNSDPQSGEPPANQKRYLPPSGKNAESGNAKQNGICEKCGETKAKGKYGKPYCVPCWIQKKEAEEQAQTEA